MFRNFEKSLGKQRLWHRCFPANFAKFLITPFLHNTSGDWFCSLLNFLLNITLNILIVHSESERSSETLLNISSLLCILCLLFILCILRMCGVKVEVFYIVGVFLSEFTLTAFENLVL